MNLDSLFIPARLAALMVEAKSFELTNLEQYSERMLVVPERFLADLFIELGAISVEQIQKMNSSNTKNEPIAIASLHGIDNEENKSILPQALVEIWQQEEGNAIRCIMSYKGLSLKEASERYGGKSGASNLANFLSKTDDELNQVRPSTLSRIAESLGCPVEWFRLLAKLQRSIRPNE